MYIKAQVKRDRVTKNLTKRLTPGDIALISHRDLDEVAARSLVEKEVVGIINTEETISGKYPNRGPEVLMKEGIPIFEVENLEAVEGLNEGDIIEISKDSILKDGKIVARCIHLEDETIKGLLKKGFDNIEKELDAFIENTLEYAKKEKGLVTGSIKIPRVKTNFNNRHVLVVVRGQDYKQDFVTIKNYIDEVKPILVGVDGGGDALLEFGYTPDVVIGDMDSVSDNCLLSAKEVIVHAFRDGRAPGYERVKNLGIDPIIYPSPGTSEDIALLLAYENNADLIVALGTHTNMIDFLEKGRKGMASTFLTRLKVGDKLVDARGVNKLYGSDFNIKYLIVIIIAAFIPILILTLINPITRNFLKLLKIRFMLMMGM